MKKLILLLIVFIGLHAKQHSVITEPAVIKKGHNLKDLHNFDAIKIHNKQLGDLNLPSKAYEQGASFIAFNPDFTLSNRYTTLI